MFGDFRLKVFMTLSRTGNFTRAADELGISQPAVSQNIAELEKELGVRLFDRGRSEISLTQPGRLFQRYARNIMHWYDSAQSAFSADVSSMSGILRLCASSDIESAVVPALVSSLSTACPDLTVISVPDGFSGAGDAADIRIVSSVLSERVRYSSVPREVDMPLSVSYDDSFPSPVVGVFPTFAVSAPHNSGVYGRFSTDAVPRVALWSPSGFSGSAAADPEGEDGGFDCEDLSLSGLPESGRPRVVFRSGSAEAVKRFVSSSAGVIGVLPSYAVFNEIMDRALVRVPSVGGDSARAVLFVPSPAFSREPLCRTVRRLLEDILLSMSGSILGQ